MEYYCSLTMSTQTGKCNESAHDALKFELICFEQLEIDSFTVMR